MREGSDERILGGGDFVDYLLKEVNQKVKHQFSGQHRLKKVEQFISTACIHVDINSGGRRGSISKIRSKLAGNLL